MSVDTPCGIRSSLERSCSPAAIPRSREFDRTIAERGGALRRTFGMGAADALIAATALEHGLQLTTRNVRDFKKIPGLRLRDPETL